MEHLRITVAGKAYDVIVEKIDGDESDNQYTPAPVIAPPAPVPPAAPAPALAAASAQGRRRAPVTSPVRWPASSRPSSSSVGAAVNEGDLVLTLEAMKMYTSINASATGTIKAIHVKVGDAVEEGQVLYTIG